MSLTSRLLICSLPLLLACGATPAAQPADGDQDFAGGDAAHQAQDLPSGDLSAQDLLSQDSQPADQSAAPDLPSQDSEPEPMDLPPQDQGAEEPGDAPEDLGGSQDMEAREDMEAEDMSPQEACAPPPPGLPELAPRVQGRYHIYEGLVDRRVVVYLPQGYQAEGPRRYPVLYLHDGQNLFHDQEAAFGVAWQVDDVLDALVQRQALEPWIVVALDNTAARISDYTPDPDPEYGGGQGARYQETLIQRVKPWIEHHYAVRCGAPHAALAGSSLGGLISLDTVTRHPGVFGRVGAISPSLWWNRGSALARLESWEGPLPQRLWLDAGSAEGEATPGGASSVSRDARQALSLLLRRGATYGRQLAYLEELGAAHNEAAWNQRLEPILLWLLGDADYSQQAPARSSLHLYRARLAEQEASDLVLQRAYADGVRLSEPWPALELAPQSTARWRDGQLWGQQEGVAVLSAPGEARALVQVGGDPGLTAARVEVSAPPGTERVHLSGDLAALGSWDGAGLALEPGQDGRWALTWMAPTGASVEYKYTQGSWARVEKGAQGEELDNRRLELRRPVLVQDQVLRWAP